VTAVRFNVVIPARLASTRLPGKPLLDLAGRPMIVRVWEQARSSGATDVIVATDDDRIAEACRDAGAHVEMTAATHACGTDRIHEVAERLEWDDDLIVVNVQGDEPLIPPVLIDQVASLLARHRAADIATLVTTFVDEDEFLDAHSAKVVIDREGFALYFSRSPIPQPGSGGLPPSARRHIGLYAYRVGALRLMAESPVCGLEKIERLEQLRALWNGQRIVVADAAEVPPRGVDTASDLEFVRAILAERVSEARGNR
jgi:3-deoxy-manno-octulosonate cytidylyltransferase (CMP-KDO synthetase)